MDLNSDWGKYSPPKKANKLRYIIKVGLSRGIIRKEILKTWRAEYGDIVDIEVRDVKYRLNLDDNVTDGKILASSKEYDGVELASLLLACKEDPFIDIGANIGYYSLVLASRGVKKVFAIEPNPPTLERLRYNVSINTFKDNITVLPIGIGEEGSFELYSTGDLGSASLLEPRDKKTTKVTINTHPLFDILKEHDIKKLGAIKIDVEGLEDKALLPFFKTAPTSLWPTCIVIEHCNKEDWEMDIIEYLQNNGYQATYKSRGNTILTYTN